MEESIKEFESGETEVIKLKFPSGSARYISYLSILHPIYGDHLTEIFFVRVVAVTFIVVCAVILLRSILFPQ